MKDLYCLLNKVMFSIGISSRDMSYNSRRGILAALPPLVGRKSYHLFTISPYYQNRGQVAKLCRKPGWDSEFEKLHGN